MAIEKERQVNESPRESDVDVPILREFGHALNQIIKGWPVVATANLPAADPKLDGMVVIEQGAGSTRNIVAYATGLRIRFTGTNF